MEAFEGFWNIRGCQWIEGINMCVQLGYFGSLCSRICQGGATGDFRGVLGALKAHPRF